MTSESCNIHHSVDTFSSGDRVEWNPEPDTATEWKPAEVVLVYGETAIVSFGTVDRYRVETRHLRIAGSHTRTFESCEPDPIQPAQALTSTPTGESE